MKNRKGFTLVELVIVIAVIAILAGVLIGTFASVIKRANDSANVQKIKSEEIAQKAEDILKKIDDSNWYGWEEYEADIVAKITAEIKGNASGLTKDQVEKIINDALATWKAQEQVGNKALTEEQVKAIVENALGLIKYEGVTEAQVRAIVLAAANGVQGTQLTAAQVKSIVNAANANNLTAAQLANIVANYATTGNVETILSQISALSTTVQGLATSEQVEELKSLIENKIIEQTDDEVTAKALNIKIKKAGLTSAGTAYEVVEAINEAPASANILLSIEEGQLGFFVMSGTSVLNKCGVNVDTDNMYKYWVFDDKVSATYSTYLTGVPTVPVEPDGVGLDVGEQTVDTISYTNTTGSGRDVVIHTNSADTTLTVNASADSVKHYGVLGKLILTDIDYDCFYEYGKTAYAEATKGKIVAKEGGTVQVLFATAAAVAAVEDGGTIGNAYCVSTAEAEALSTGYNNFSDSKSGNVEFKYVDSDMNPITVGSVATIASASQDELKIEEIETSGLYEARIGTVGYSTFDEAVAAATDSDTVVLCKNVLFGEDRSVPVWTKRGFDIDLNGCVFETQSSVNWNLGNNAYVASAICYSSADSKTATISNGNIKTKYGAGLYADDPGMTVTLANVNIYQDYNNYVQSSAEYSTAIRITGKANVVVNGGRYEGNYSLVVSNSGGHFVINDGTFVNKLFFSANTSNGLTNSDKTITINGGTFVNFGVENANKGVLTIYGGTFDADPTTYVASGYHATNNGNGTWTVVAD